MFAAAASVGFGIAGCEKQIRDTDIKLVTAGQVKALWDAAERGQTDQLILLDPRPPKEFSAEHIKGARSLTLPQVSPRGDRDPGIERFKNLVVYGNDPGSATARGMTKRLLAVGYEHVRFFAGGLKEWKARGYPVEGRTPEAPVPQEGEDRFVEPEPTPTTKPDLSPEPNNPPSGPPDPDRAW